MTGIVDYGVGNLFSLRSSLKYIGAESLVSGDPGRLAAADRLILPGVGAFQDAADKLRQSGLDSFLIEQARAGKAILGICLGMQLLFEESYEFGRHRGLGLLKGCVMPLEGYIPPTLKIPHIGWNALELKREHRLLKYLKTGDCVYFVHSFSARLCEQSVIAAVEYGRELCAAAASDNVMGCQFHPEKSGEAGLGILRAFCEGE